MRNAYTDAQPQVKGWPALFGAAPHTVEPEKQDDWLYLPELLVVGGVSMDTGEVWQQTGFDPHKGLPQIYAPADHILGTVGDKRKWVNGNPAAYRPTAGTSVCKLRLS